MTFRTTELHDISCDITGCKAALNLGMDPEGAEREGWEQSVPIGSKTWDLCPEHARGLDSFLTGTKWEMPTEVKVGFTPDETLADLPPGQYDVTVSRVQEEPFDYEPIGFTSDDEDDDPVTQDELNEVDGIDL